VASETYNAVYDAALAALGGGYLHDNVRETLFAVETAAYEQKRPSTLYRPTLSADGDMWCALLGDDLQVGVAGFGKTPAEAMVSFDIAFLNERTPAASRMARESAQ
jgi:uncharacterized protein YcfJ